MISLISGAKFCWATTYYIKYVYFQVFLPCGHLICCVQCAPALKDCPLCRQPIHGTVKTYMS